MQTDILKIQAMNDQACADAILGVLEAIDGVSRVSVSLAGKRATVQFDERLASRASLDAALAQAGYRAEPAAPTGCCGGCGGQ